MQSVGSGYWRDPVSGKYYNSTTGQWYDSSGYPSSAPVSGNSTAGSGSASAAPTSAASNNAMQPVGNLGYYQDPVSKYYYNSNTGQWYDPSGNRVSAPPTGSQTNSTTQAPGTPPGYNYNPTSGGSASNPGASAGSGSPYNAH